MPYELVFDFRSQFGLWEPLDNRQRQLPATTCHYRSRSGFVRSLYPNEHKFDLNTQYQRVPVTQNNNLLRKNLI